MDKGLVMNVITKFDQRPATVTQKPLAQETLVKRMERSGYRFVGRHSAIKICNWTRQSIRGVDSCYKCKFYGISSNRCIQMTPTVFWCSFNCPHCWRQHRYTLPPENIEWDSPTFILDECIREQIQILQGFKGSSTADQEKVEKAMMPKHVAISLAGEPTLYPMLPEFIVEVIWRGMTAYLVTNGTNPDAVKKLINYQPTNLYISVYGATPDVYKRTTAWMIENAFNRVMQSLSFMKQFSCNTVFRMTLMKNLNMVDAEGYATLIEDAQPTFVELKGYKAVGGSQKRLGPEFMPTHEEIMAFAELIQQHTDYTIVDQKENSSVALLTKGDTDYKQVLTDA